MAVKWTDEQLNAIRTVDKGVVVPAAAGSGKTAVLIERTVRMLENIGQLPAEKLLAVTFTKDAAAQMKNKLRRALADRISAEHDKERRDWLIRQQEMLALANISTISSFCFELVKENLNEFDYRTGIRIADDTQIQVLRDNAIYDTLEEMRREEPERAELLADAFSARTDIDTDSCTGLYVADLYNFKRSLAFPEEWTDYARKGFTDEDRVNGMIDEFFGLIEEKLGEMVAMNDQYRILSAELPNNEKLMELCGKDLDVLGGIRAAVKAKDMEGIFKACKEKFPSIRKPSAKGLDEEQSIRLEEKYNVIKDIRDKMKKKKLDPLKKTIEKFGSKLTENIHDAGLIFEALNDAAERLGRIMFNYKLEQDIAEFGDIERMAVELLVTKENGVLKRTPLAERIRRDGQHQILLIDEFQDVNDLQELIFRVLSDTDDLEVLGKNVFVVGDVKQAIYRFRLSNPRLFLKATEDARNDEIKNLTEIRLTKNFRSRENVLAFINSIFRRIMSTELGEVEYDENEQLYYGADYSGTDPAEEIMLIKDSEEASEEQKYVVFGAEELAVARRIKTMTETGVLVTESPGKLRKCTQSDFCVLARNGDTLRRVAEALKYVGLQPQGDETKGYMGSQEIVTMIELLKVIDNPVREIPLASVMLSPIMGFTAEELARIRLKCFEEDSRYPKRLYQVLMQIAAPEDADEKESEHIDIGDSALEAKCRAAAELLSHLRSYSACMGIEELITRIYDETGFFAAASAYENADQRRANLRLLTHRAAEYEKNNIGGIAGFLRFLDCLTAAKGDFTQAVKRNTGMDSVKVKTFHGSKGLEFPIVFLVGLGKQFNMSDLREKVIYDSRWGAAISYLRHDKLMKVTTVPHYIMSERVKAELLGEEMRLLYVALTRAKERLVIPIYLKKSSARYNVPKRLRIVAEEIIKSGKASAEVLLEMKSSLEWTAAALMLTDDPTPLLKAIECEELADELRAIAPKDDIVPRIVWHDPDDDPKYGGGVMTYNRPAPNEDNVAKLIRQYDMKYEGIEERAPSKRTVTEIVSEINRKDEGDEKTDFAFYPQLGTLKEEADRLTAAQRGTYTHLFMELADYDRAEQSVKDELERLRSSGRMSDKEAQGVYVSAVQKFFKGELYQRMKQSPEPLQRERSFMVSAQDAGIDKKFSKYIAEDGMLQGICDCIFREGDGYVLVDYKTDGFADESEEKRYDVQLELYKAALDLILPLPVRSCYIYSFKLGKGTERHIQ